MAKLSIKIVKNCKFFIDFKKDFLKLPRRPEGSAPDPPRCNPLTSPPLVDLDPRKIPNGANEYDTISKTSVRKKELG